MGKVQEGCFSLLKSQLASLNSNYCHCSELQQTRTSQLTATPGATALPTQNNFDGTRYAECDNLHYLRLLSLSSQLNLGMQKHGVKRVWANVPWKWPQEVNSPQRMTVLNINGVDSVKVSWAPIHCASLNSQDSITKQDDPRHTITLRRYATRTDPLWWNCLATKDISPRVVRSWSVNRVRVAFKNALRRKGYDENGYRLTGAGEGRGHKKDLVGSVQLMTLETLIQTSWPQLEEEADRIVAEVEQHTADFEKPRPGAWKGLRKYRRTV